ncbi:MAG: sulfatase-like hydrolase/transferase [Chloroflexi bacterium]|nr:sulfatase-like hydrolase/transferase [Chloroflexota bacterium]
MPSTAAAGRPNIVLVITDQQRYDTIAALGHPHVDTPNLDRLVREGVSFDQCHVTAASCVPARASLFNGLYPHTTGVMRNGCEWRRSWVEQLAASGYHCVNVGKMHTVPFETPLGFHERYVVENKDRFLDGRYYFDEWDKALAARGLVKQQRELYRQRPDYRDAMGAFTWDLPADMHSDNFVGGLARWWVDTYPTTQPLFLEVGFPGPHPPYDPTPEALAPYLVRDLPIRPVSQADLNGQPEALRVMREHNTEVDHDSVVHIVDPPLESRHRQRAHYLANVTMIDTQMGELMDALERNGYADDCVVIFTSDHGDCLGDHGHIQKWTMYDTITRVPCVVWSPNRFAGGRRIDNLIQWFDLGPTILELAGCQPDASMEARSLLPALNGGQAPHRDYVFTEQGRDDGNGLHVDLVTAVRSQTWKLVHFLGEDDGQLFNLQDDPYEERNLWNDPLAAPARRELLDALRDWRLSSGVTTANWAADAR